MKNAIWPVQLFNKSVLKQTKFKQITDALGPTTYLHCLDIGSDNGVISYLLRQRGGTWKSADLDERSVRAMEELVGEHVYRIDGRTTPFQDDEFDCVVIVDFLEHVHTDREFIGELYRILKPGGTLIVNVPYIQNDLLTRFRNAIGLTDEDHGHVRPGYTLESIRALLGENFTVRSHGSYTKFFSKFIDVLMSYAISWLKRKNQEKKSGRGVLVMGSDLKAHGALFSAYAMVYPLVRAISALDALLFFAKGYMLIVRAQSNKQLAFKPQSDGYTFAEQTNFAASKTGVD